MKNRTNAKPLLALAIMVLGGHATPVLVAQPVVAAENPRRQPPAPVQLPAHVSEVLKLAHGGVSDGIIVAYINNSGKVYPLEASEILYLREQGVSDQVLDRHAQPAAEPGRDRPATKSRRATSSLDNREQPAIRASPRPAAPNYVEMAP